jgi:hypothetical protein
MSKNAKVKPGLNNYVWKSCGASLNNGLQGLKKKHALMNELVSIYNDKQKRDEFFYMVEMAIAMFPELRESVQRMLASTTLPDARNKGVEARQTASKDKQERIEKVVKDLRNHKDTKNKTAEQIRDYILERKSQIFNDHTPYSPESTLKHVNNIISQIKKNR